LSPLSWSVDAEGVCTLLLTREPLNEIGEESLDRLEALVAEVQAPDVRGLLIASEIERGFCAGADLKALHRAIEARGHAQVVAEVRSFLGRIHCTFGALDRLPKPTVSAVHGVVFGGGLELALTSDLIVAARSARFGFPELRLGLIPGFGGTVRLRRAIGGSRLLDLLLTGRSLNAERAHQVGLVSQVVAVGRPRAAARRALLQALKTPPAALAAAKRVVKAIDEAALAAEREAFLDLFARPECARALAEFARREDVLPYLAR
jgi:enoyl-CoA hydratase/carnithine racemase